ncbi:CBS domain-containing protein [Ruania zhangjianzhongii]|uniref:CBS domain-containing protein n=1 Tax=Ruania zhangjianzhongii TaxID=2603206 RepID=UPI00143CCA66|nr:CBS domain-containing protein [Ruania zhangjianzhongii]
MTSTDPQADSAACANPSVGRDQAATRPVRDVMISTPKTLPAAATAGDARTLFSNPKVLSVPLVDGASFAGLLDREDLPESATDEAPIRGFARRSVPTITPERSMQEALDLMASTETVRLVVLADDGRTLRGLLALNHDRDGFCLGS